MGSRLMPGARALSMGKTTTFKIMTYGMKKRAMAQGPSKSFIK
jgi:hypothetical protein